MWLQDRSTASPSSRYRSLKFFTVCFRALLRWSMPLRIGNGRRQLWRLSEGVRMRLPRRFHVFSDRRQGAVCAGLHTMIRAKNVNLIVTVEGEGKGTVLISVGASALLRTGRRV